ncbi:hypothetical protein C8R46DRAFT_1219788 [Mycena filopes]|nr:hypothetical protein C8R46DRAFT_1219788 [Mycena filopes]
MTVDRHLAVTAVFRRAVYRCPKSPTARHGTRSTAPLALEKDPKLPQLIKELLATTPLPAKVPYPTASGDANSGPTFVDLQFPQTTASKSFVQRELGLAMAIAANVVAACVKHGSDEQLFEVYHRCVPAIQTSLKENFAKPVDVICSTASRTLATCPEHQRDDAWNKTILGSVWPAKNSRNPKYISAAHLPVSADSSLNLVEKLFELLETFPPLRSDSKSDPADGLESEHRTPTSMTEHPVMYKLPDGISARFLSFLQSDLPRSLALVTRLCCWVDADGNQHISFPTSFAKDRYSCRFWHGLDLQMQRAHMEPFLASLVESNGGALLKSGQLKQLDLLGEIRWPVVHSVTTKVIALLRDCKVTEERPNVIAFILSAIKILHARLVPLAAVDSPAKRKDQSVIEEGASELIIVSTLQSVFLNSVLLTLDHYHTLVKVLFESVFVVFSMQHVSAWLLHGLVPEFLAALTPKPRTIFTIPDDGVTQLYSNLPSGDNDGIFQVVLGLWPPREHISFWTNSVTQYLSPSQKSHIWALLDDAEFLVPLLADRIERSSALHALTIYSPSPSAHHRIIQKALLSDGMEEIIMLLYDRCDISDPVARTALTKMTSKRLIWERLEVYQTLMRATDASNSIQEFPNTMNFFVPRIQSPDARHIPSLFTVSKIIDLLRRATDDEAAEIAAVYVAWESLVNEAVSPIPAISAHILTIVNHCLTIFAANPSGGFFQMALQILWARCLNEHGLSRAKVEFVTCSAHHATDVRDEADELAFRTFLGTLGTVNKLTDYGLWRIQDEEVYVEFMHGQNQKNYALEVFC